MSKYNPSTFDQRLRRLEADNDRLRHQVEQMRVAKKAKLVDERDIRWAVTTNVAGYPTSDANTFPIRFLEPHFTNSTGLRTFTATNKSTSSVTQAHAQTGQFIPPFLPVPVFWQRGLGGQNKGEWWFLDPPRTYVVNLLQTLSYRGSALAEIWLPNSAKVLFPSGISITVHDVALLPGTAVSPGDIHGRDRLIAHWYFVPYAHWIVAPTNCCTDEDQTSGEQTSVHTSFEQTSEEPQTSEQTSEEQTSIPAFSCCDGEGWIGTSPGAPPLYLTITQANAPLVYDDPNPANYDIAVISPRTGDIKAAFVSPATGAIRTANQTHPLDPGPYPFQVYEHWVPSCTQRRDPLTEELLFPDDPTQREWIIDGYYGRPGTGFGGDVSFRVRLHESGTGVWANNGTPAGSWDGSFACNVNVLSCVPFHMTADFTLPSTVTSGLGTFDVRYPLQINSAEFISQPTSLEFTE